MNRRGKEKDVVRWDKDPSFYVSTPTIKGITVIFYYTDPQNLPVKEVVKYIRERNYPRNISPSFARPIRGTKGLRGDTGNYLMRQRLK